MSASKPYQQLHKLLHNI